MPSSLAADVQPEIEYVYYPVPYMEGKSVGDTIAINTPLKGRHGSRAMGLTQWRIRYGQVTFDRPTIGVCRIKEVAVTCSCRISLPKLEGGDERFRAEFDQAVEKTRRHELEHCRIAVVQANKLERAFNDFKEHPCKKVRSKMREVYVKILDEGRTEQVRFDDVEYGYRHYHELRSIQSMIDAGFEALPAPEGRFKPRLNPKGRTRLEVLPQDDEALARDGIYKDKDGVWRNY